MTEYSSLQNQFLIAMPQMADPNFSGTVTYICDHNDRGAMGIIINRPLDIQLNEIFEQMDIESEYGDIEIYGGGPVQVDRGFVLHRQPGQWQSSIRISDTIYLTTSKDVLHAFASGTGPENSLIALGYAGWGAGQLEQEIQEGCWLNCPASEAILFDTPCFKRFDCAMGLLGINVSQLSGQVGHS